MEKEYCENCGEELKTPDYCPNCEDSPYDIDYSSSVYGSTSALEEVLDG